MAPLTRVLGGNTGTQLWPLCGCSGGPDAWSPKVEHVNAKTSGTDSSPSFSRRVLPPHHPQGARGVAPATPSGRRHRAGPGTRSRTPHRHAPGCCPAGRPARGRAAAGPGGALLRRPGQGRLDAWLVPGTWPAGANARPASQSARGLTLVRRAPLGLVLLVLLAHGGGAGRARAEGRREPGRSLATAPRPWPAASLAPRRSPGRAGSRRRGRKWPRPARRRAEPSASGSGGGARRIQSAGGAGGP